MELQEEEEEEEVQKDWVIQGLEKTYRLKLSVDSWLMSFRS